MCKVYTRYHVSSKTEHGLCACTIDNFLAKARGLSLRTGAQTMLYLSLVVQAYLQFMAKTVKWSNFTTFRISKVFGRNIEGGLL